MCKKICEKHEVYYNKIIDWFDDEIKSVNNRYGLQIHLSNNKDVDRNIKQINGINVFYSKNEHSQIMFGSVWEIDVDYFIDPFDEDLFEEIKTKIRHLVRLLEYDIK